MTTENLELMGAGEAPSTSSPLDEREVVITRILNAPRDRVFQAWTDGVLMKQWWGPNGFTNPVCDLDVRPGGEYRIVMRSPDGIEYPLKGVYTEVVPPAYLVLTDNWEEHPAEWKEALREAQGDDRLVEEAVNFVTFVDDGGGRTQLTIRSRFSSPAVRNAMLQQGMNEGWTQSLERLERLLSTK
ncbi:MAG: SRPBCC family protein [Deltaproteobacteria bacterium]|nr:SRPBCC family protein [Deltaproteobacteria bacterium]